MMKLREGDNALPYSIYPMRKENITQVNEIGQEGDPSQQPPVNYDSELKNKPAHYIVACDDAEMIEKIVVGFAGIRVMAGVALIINIVVRKCYQRQGIGELLLISILDMAEKLKADIMTLEVRATNGAALSLYYKYGFKKVGIRRGYHMDNKEDGILMVVEGIDSASFKEHLQQLKQKALQRMRVGLK